MRFGGRLVTFHQSTTVAPMVNAEAISISTEHVFPPKISGFSR